MHFHLTNTLYFIYQILLKKFVEVHTVNRTVSAEDIAISLHTSVLYTKSSISSAKFGRGYSWMKLLSPA